MNLQTIYKEIIADNVKSAFLKVKQLPGDDEKKNPVASNILKALNEFIYRLNQKKISYSSSPTDIYELTRYCCDILSKNWKCKRLSFMQCLYHITKFLLDTHPYLSRNLCEFYLKLEKDTQNVPWDAQETVVLSNIIYIFSNKIHKNYKDICKNIFGEEEKSLISWINFIIRLYTINNYDKVFKLFLVFTNLLPEIHEAENHQCFVQFGQFCVTTLTNLFNKIPKGQLQVTDKDYSCFVVFLHFNLFYLNHQEIKSGAELVKKSIHRFKDSTECNHESLDLLEQTLNFCTEDSDSDTLQILETMCSLIKTKWNVRDKGIFPTVAKLLFTFRETIVNRAITKDNLPLLLSFIEELQKYFNKDSSSPREIVDKVNIIYTAMYFTFTPSLEKDTLKSVFSYIKCLTSAYIRLATNATLKQGLLAFAVSGFVNTLIVYKKQELFNETATISMKIMKYLISLEKPLLLPIKAYIERISTIMALSLGKMGCGVDAQIGLIAFAALHTDLQDVVFKSWAELKNANESSPAKESTVISVINENNETMEQSWPPFKVDQIDIDMLLFWEVKSYSKFRSLHNEPVVAAYITAAKYVKNNLMLAAILIAAVDCVTTEEIFSKIGNFEKSLNNLAQLLNQNQNTKDAEHSATVSCILGNIYYQLLRCDLLRLRKKTEDEVILLDVKPENVPIFQADQGDELDDTTFAPAFGYLKLEAQAHIFTKMDQSYSYWKASVDSLVPSNITSSTLQYIKAMGYLYRLYKFKVKELQIWELLYKMADKFSSLKYKVLAISEMLILKQTLDSKLIEEIEKQLQNHPEISSKSYIYQLFFVNLAKNKFNNGQVVEASAIFNKLNETLLNYNFLVFAQYKISTVIIEWCNVKNSPNAKEFSVYPIVKIFENLLYFIKFNKWNTFSELCVVQWLLLETSQLLGVVYTDLQYVRYARCYTKNQLTVAQRLALPLRVCDLLSVLSWNDLHCWNSIDCDMKLRGVESILELDAIDMEVGTQYRPSSPRLVEKYKCVPHFLEPEKDCVCHYCNNIDYQIQALNLVTLRAMFLVSDSKSEAKAVFKVGHRIIEYIENKKSTDGVLVSNLTEAVIRFYMALSKAYYCWNKYDEALEYNKTSLQALQKYPIQNAVLEFCLKIHSNCLMWEQDSLKDRKPKENPRKLKKALPIVKTPEQTEMPINMKTPEEVKKSFVTPRVFHHRKLTFDDASDDDAFCKPLGSKPKGFAPLNFDNDDDSDFLSAPLSNKVPVKTYSNKNTLFKDLMTTNLKSFQTPQEKVKTRTRAQTEKKIPNNQETFVTNLLSTGSKPKPAIKIYCDDENEKPSTRNKVKPSARKNILNPPSTLKKPSRSVAKSSNRTTEKPTRTRKLVFDDSQSDDDIKLVSSSKSKTKERTIIPTIDLTDEPTIIESASTSCLDTPVTSKANEKCLPVVHIPDETSHRQQEMKISMETPTISNSSGDISFVDVTPPKDNGRKLLDLTPQTLGEQFSKLTLNVKTTSTSEQTDSTPLTAKKRILPPRTGLRSKRL